MAGLSKKKVEAMIRSARARGRAVAKGAGGAKESAFAAVGGALARLAQAHIPASITSPWLRAGLVGAGGHFLKKKHKAAGLGVLGAAGAAAYDAFQAYRAEQAAKKAAAATQAAGLVFNRGPHNAYPAQLVAEASGYDDAGALYGPGVDPILAAGAPRALGRPSSTEKINSL